MPFKQKNENHFIGYTGFSGTCVLIFSTKGICKRVPLKCLSINLYFFKVKQKGGNPYITYRVLEHRTNFNNF